LPSVYEHNKDGSLWSEFLKVQPSRYDNILYFSEEDLSLLEGSNTLQYSRLIRDQFHSDYRILFVEGLSILFPAIFSLEKYTLSAYQWALSLVWSRAYDLPKANIRKDSKPTLRTLIPFGDMFNHDITSLNTHLYNASTDKMEYSFFPPPQGWKKGEQIFINYGPFCNAKLLKVYGFSLPDNPYDEVEVWASMDERAPYYHIKQLRLQQLGLSFDRVLPFRLTRKGVPGSLISAMRIQFAEEDELDKYENAVTYAGLSEDNEKLAIHFLLQCFTSMFRAYPTSISQDRILLAALEAKLASTSFSDSSLPTRLYHQLCAIRTRLGEKEVLSAAIEYLKFSENVFKFNNRSGGESDFRDGYFI
jgi:hypothetical protein